MRPQLKPRGANLRAWPWLDVLCCLARQQPSPIGLGFRVWVLGFGAVASSSPVGEAMVAHHPLVEQNGAVRTQRGAIPSRTPNTSRWSRMARNPPVRGLRALGWDVPPYTNSPS